MSVPARSALAGALSLAFLFCFVADPPELAARDGTGRAGSGPSASTGASAPVVALAFTPCGERLLCGSQAGARLLEWPALGDAGDLELDGELGAVRDLRFSPDGRLLAVAGGSAAVRGEVRVISWPGRERVHAATSGTDLVHCVAWPPGGGTYAAASHDRALRVHDATSGEVLRELRVHSRPVLAVVDRDGGRLLASAGDDASIRIHEATTGAEVRVLDNHAERVTVLCVRPGPPDASGPLLASASTDGTVRFWQPAIGRLVRFARTPAKQLALAWLPDARHVVCAASDGRVRVVDSVSAAVVAELDGVVGWAYALAVPPAGAPGGIALGGEGGRVVRIELDVADAGDDPGVSRENPSEKQ